VGLGVAGGCGGGVLCDVSVLDEFRAESTYPLSQRLLDEFVIDDLLV
jgi:hypothetical protein